MHETLLRGQGNSLLKYKFYPFNILINFRTDICITLSAERALRLEQRAGGEASSSPSRALFTTPIRRVLEDSAVPNLRGTRRNGPHTRLPRPAVVFFQEGPVRERQTRDGIIVNLLLNYLLPTVCLFIYLYYLLSYMNDNMDLF